MSDYLQRIEYDTHENTNKVSTTVRNRNLKDYDEPFSQTYYLMKDLVKNIRFIGDELSNPFFDVKHGGQNIKYSQPMHTPYKSVPLKRPKHSSLMSGENNFIKKFKKIIETNKYSTDFPNLYSNQKNLDLRRYIESMQDKAKNYAVYSANLLRGSETILTSRSTSTPTITSTDSESPITNTITTTKRRKFGKDKKTTPEVEEKTSCVTTKESSTTERSSTSKKTVVSTITADDDEDYTCAFESCLESSTNFERSTTTSEDEDYPFKLIECKPDQITKRKRPTTTYHTTANTKACLKNSGYICCPVCGKRMKFNMEVFAKGRPSAQDPGQGAPSYNPTGTTCISISNEGADFLFPTTRRNQKKASKVLIEYI